MSLSSTRDKQYADKEASAKRRKQRSCKPPDNYGDNYVTGMEKLRTQGKGSNYRNIPGWYSDEMTERFNKIFNRSQENQDNEEDGQEETK